MRTNLDEMASNVSDGVVKFDREICVWATFMHSAIENYSMLQESPATVTTMVGVSRNKKIRNEIAFHDYLA